MQPELNASFGQVIALHEDVQPADYVLNGSVCTIGRAPECHIVIVRRQVVSRTHARIERVGSRYVLHDAGSVNGTFVNEQPITGPHMLKDRDLIGFGAAAPLLRFLDPDPTARVSGRLRYDEAAMVFRLDEQKIELTPTQLRLMLYLYRHAGTVCPRESCAQAIWGRDYDPGMDADALDRTINTLRARLRDVDPTADLIQTRRGIGYLLAL